MFIVTVSDVVWGVIVIFTVVVVAAMWVAVTLMDRQTRKRHEAERAKREGMAMAQLVNEHEHADEEA